MFREETRLLVQDWRQRHYKASNHQPHQLLPNIDIQSEINNIHFLLLCTLLSLLTWLSPNILFISFHHLSVLI